jgi:DNA replication and repair protein RecF
MVEIAWLHEHLEIQPILLLDDVFSELDEFRREALLATLPDSQVIITTPEADVLPKSFAKDASITMIDPASQEDHA